MLENQLQPEQTPSDIYQVIFDQIRKFSRNHSAHTTFLSEDEYLTTMGDSLCTLQFSTTNLNISAVHNPEGAYPNTFTFNFDPERMSLSYYEAVPRRLETIVIEINDYVNSQEFIDAIRPYIEKINLLIEYFKLTEKIEIPT